MEVAIKDLLEGMHSSRVTTVDFCVLDLCSTKHYGHFPIRAGIFLAETSRW